MITFGWISSREDGEGTVEEVETLKEKVKVKVKDGDDYFYKRYDCSDIKIIKNIEKHKIDPEEKEHQKELEELEKLEKTDTVEDRIVKQRFAGWCKGCTCPPDFPVFFTAFRLS